MVPAILKRVLPHWPVSAATWTDCARILLALFFINAALYKLSNYLLVGDQILADRLQDWIDYGWPVSWYEKLMVWYQPYDRLIATHIIVSQYVCGLLWLTNRWLRIGALILFFVQINIFLAAFHNSSFIEFTGISLWVCLFFFLRPSDGSVFSRKQWMILTWILAALCFLQLFNRTFTGDQWPSSMVNHRENFAADIMSISSVWKPFVLWLLSLPGAAYVYAGSWWLHIPLILGLFTRYRLYCGAIILTFWIITCWTWMNFVTSQGVLWVLTMFLWCTEEYALRKQGYAK